MDDFNLLLQNVYVSKSDANSTNDNHLEWHIDQDNFILEYIGITKLLSTIYPSKWIDTSNLSRYNG